MLSYSGDDRGDAFNSSEPLVSVVMPAFNASPYIVRSLQSAARQTYQSLEIIVVNDGSTDDTAKLVEQMAVADSRIRLLTTPNRGVAAARNTGIQASSGQFVAFLDADDLWHQTKIEKQVNALNRLSPQWAAVYSLHYVIDLDDEIIYPGRANVARGYIYARHLTFKYVGNGSTLLVRRDVALEIGGFDSSYAAAGIEGCEDLDFELRLAAHYYMEVIPERLVGYRQYPGNMSSNHIQMARGALEVVRRSLAANPQLPRYAARSATTATVKYAFQELKRAESRFQSLMAAWAIFLNDPQFILRLAFQEGLRGIQQCLPLRTKVTRSADPPRLNRSKFDEQSVPARVECPEENARSQRHLMRLTAIDVRLSSILESAGRLGEM
ncbi:glycosyltransferase involved in cell wall biosynthesis [Rhizobium leguminosarum]|uniref:glycosyltransferase family 2 protein n=1 Tax=Rhizobium leguminosarum TaxID=384 RepID=UPI0024B34C92|nr:glycosyltransferase family A protein [Rhizobium leguminosarum]WHO84277.1 glycosyltransferase family 2 protein [Rhizobium leguminosarum]